MMRRTYFLNIILKGRIILAFFSCLTFAETYAQNADIILLRKINVQRNPILDPAFRFVSNTVMPLSFAVPCGLAGAGLYNHDPVLVNQAMVAGASLILANALSAGLKYGIHRKRPFVTYEDIQKETRAGPYSFPSGHTTSAFATATSLCLAFPKWYVIAPSCVWAGLVAYSRMHLGVHYPSDVLAGILLGVGSSLLCYEAQGLLIKK
jgi:membrane-associated phospholipid phosphatase